jgi:hypothetical protein
MNAHRMFLVVWGALSIFCSTGEVRAQSFVPKPVAAVPRPVSSANAPESSTIGAPSTRSALRTMIVWRLLSDETVTQEAAVGLLELSRPVDWSQFMEAARRNEHFLDDEVVALLRLDEALAAQAASAEESLSAEVTKAEHQLAIAQARHNERMLGETARVIRISNWISWVICVIAHLILAIGLWAAVREFNHALRTRAAAPEPTPVATLAAADGAMTAADAAKIALAETEIKISLEGVALKTALHGLLLLAVAIGFYFLYLKFVYPITLVGG